MSFLKLNQNQIIYDHNIKKYSVGGRFYETFAEAKSKQWLCNKCDAAFGTMKELRMHKIDSHSY